MRNNGGFTVVEITMGAVFVGIIASAGVTVMHTFNTSKLLSESKIGQIQLQTEIKNLFLSNSACMSALTSFAFDPGSNSEITLRLGNGNLVGQSPPNNIRREYSTEITSLSLVNKVQTAILPSGNRIFFARLQLGSRALDRKSFMTVPITSVSLQVNTANQIVGCQTVEPTTLTPGSSCTQLGGVPDGPICRTPAGRTSVNCPAGQYLQGFDTEGMVLCRAFPPPACTNETVRLGHGTGATPRFWGGFACTQSCIGQYGGGATCAGGCYSGHRGWMFCSSCERTEEVCR